MKDNIRNNIEALYKDNQKVIEFIGGVVAIHNHQIAATFYKEMLAHPEASSFLSNKLVHERLLASMAKWMSSLFELSNLDNIDKFIDWQLEIGRVHARINLPLHLFFMGLRILKIEIGKQLITSSLTKEEFFSSLVVISNLMDNLSDLINESYLKDNMENERHIQALQLETMSGSLALECERLRLSLANWLRDALIKFYSNKTNNDFNIPNIKQSDYGLWIAHKMELLFPNNVYVPKQYMLIERIGEIVDQITEYRINNEVAEYDQAIDELNTAVQDASYMMGNMIEQMLSMESTLDPLTTLMNRRYLPVILQREIEFCRKQSCKYAIVFIDLDHFKHINDSYGHDVGDKVLRKVSEIVRSVIRPGDFPFRYGGEEFLIIFTNVTEQEAYLTAERLRKKIKSCSLKLDENVINVTVSIGIALYDGNPDYKRSIVRADKAVYKAKKEGRNLCVLAS